MRRAMKVPVHLGIVLLAVFAAVVGTAVHRGAGPWGLVVAVATTGAAAVLARAAGRLLGLAEFGFTWLALVLALTYVRPGGDVIVVPGTVGYVWLGAPMALIGVAAFLPRRWFTDPPPPVPVLLAPASNTTSDAPGKYL